MRQDINTVTWHTCDAFMKTKHRNVHKLSPTVQTFCPARKLRRTPRHAPCSISPHLLVPQHHTADIASPLDIHNRFTREALQCFDSLRFAVRTRSLASSGMAHLITDPTKHLAQELASYCTVHVTFVPPFASGVNTTRPLCD